MCGVVYRRVCVEYVGSWAVSVLSVMECSLWCCVSLVLDYWLSLYGLVFVGVAAILGLATVC